MLQSRKINVIYMFIYVYITVPRCSFQGYSLINHKKQNVLYDIQCRQVLTLDTTCPMSRNMKLYVIFYRTVTSYGHVSLGSPQTIFGHRQRSIQKKTRIFLSQSGNYLLGFQLAPEEKLREVHKEITTLHRRCLQKKQIQF